MFFNTSINIQGVKILHPDCEDIVNWSKVAGGDGLTYLIVLSRAARRQNKIILLLHPAILWQCYRRTCVVVVAGFIHDIYVSLMCAGNRESLFWIIWLVPCRQERHNTIITIFPSSGLRAKAKTDSFGKKRIQTPHVKPVGGGAKRGEIPPRTGLRWPALLFTHIYTYIYIHFIFIFFHSLTDTIAP